MHGRCETDPFESAVDACSSCWGEFCGRCIASVDRHRPLCRTCAKVKSSARLGRITPKGDKKTWKKRGAALRAKAAKRADTPDNFAHLSPLRAASRGPQSFEPFQASPEPFDQQPTPTPTETPDTVGQTPLGPELTSQEHSTTMTPQRGLAALADRLQASKDR